MLEKDSASEIRGNFENHMLNNSPKVSAMNNWKNLAAKTGASAYFMTPWIPRAEEYKCQFLKIEDNSNASLDIKPLLSSCLD